jgi:hypothetical protein
MNDKLKKAKLTLMMDQRASGKAYNSASGRHASVRARTNKVVALVYYSKRCSKCEKGKPHPVNACANPGKYAKSSTCKADAMRLSRNMMYMMLKQYRQGTENCSFEKFQRAAKASFEHHWNNHQFCGTWCQAKDWTDKEKETNKNMFRNKETHQKEYQQQFGVHSKYTEEGRLRRVFHEWTTNKTEQIHSLVTNVFLPKRSYYCC